MLIRPASFRRIPRGALLSLLILEAVAILALAFLVFQVSPKSALIESTFLKPVYQVYRRLEFFGNPFYRADKAALSHYQLKIDQEELKLIEDALPTENSSPYYGSTLVLTDENKVWVKGEFTFDGTTYNVKVEDKV